MDFDGSSDYMEFDSEMSELECSVFLVVNFEDDITSGTAGQIIIGPKTTVSARVDLRVGSASGTIAGEVLTATIINGGTEFRYTVTNISAGTRLIRYVNSAADITTVHVDGTPQSVLTSGSSSNGGFLGIQRLCRNRDAFTTYFNGILREIIVYDRKLTDDETSLVESYINNKWGI